MTLRATFVFFSHSPSFWFSFYMVFSLYVSFALCNTNRDKAGGGGGATDGGRGTGTGTGGQDRERKASCPILYNSFSISHLYILFIFHTVCEHLTFLQKKEGRKRTGDRNFLETENRKPPASPLPYLSLASPRHHLTHGLTCYLTDMDRPETCMHIFVLLLHSIHAIYMPHLSEWCGVEWR